MSGSRNEERRPPRVAAAGLALCRLLLVAVTLAAAAAGTIAAGGAASAATSHQARPAGLTWQGMSLMNGWQPGESSYAGTGSPAWAVQGGIVYLSGSVVQPSGSNPLFAVLPPQARPVSVLYMTVYTVSQTQGYIVIYPSGAMYAEASPYSNAQGFTSLAAVSYPAASVTVQPLSLVNGWHSSQGQWGTGDPSYTASGGMVYLSGSLNLPGGGNSAMFAVLPPGDRPSHSLYFNVYTYAGTIGTVGVNPEGDVYAYYGQADQFTSLAGISFLAGPTPAAKLPLVNGWQSGLTQYWYTADPGITVSSGVVHLSGSVVNMPATSPFFATLPEFARPAHDLYIKITVGTSITEADTGTLLIEPDGTMQAYSIPSGLAQNFTSLDGISYSLG